MFSLLRASLGFRDNAFHSEGTEAYSPDLLWKLIPQLYTFLRELYPYHFLELDTVHWNN